MDNDFKNPAWDVESYEDKSSLCRYLMKLPAKKRLDVLLDRPDAASLVAHLADQDFFFFVKELGADDALPLLAAARVEQLIHLFDLEWWDKDAIKPANALEWLEKLAAASEGKLVEWIYQVDIELLVALLKKCLDVAVIQDDVDLVEARDQMPPNTLDDQYFWESRYPQFEDFLKRLLSILFELHPGFYREVLNRIMLVPDSMMEEDAYRLSRGRLEDHAIPDFYDALQIYKAVVPGEVLPFRELPDTDIIQESAPVFALAMLPKKYFLSAALREIENLELLNTLQMELACLGNKVIVADRLPPDEAQSLRDAVDKVGAWVNVGLERLSGGDLQVARKILGETMLEYLFRVGHSLISDPQKRLVRIVKYGWLSRWPSGLNCLDECWKEAAEFLLKKTPMIVRREEEGSPRKEWDLIRNRRDLWQAKQLVAVIEGVGDLVELMEIEPVELSKKLWPQGQIRSIEDLCLGVITFTAAAQFLTTGRWAVELLEVSQWTNLWPKLTPQNLQKALRFWIGKNISDGRRRGLVKKYFVPLLGEYAEEMGEFPPNRPPDPKLVKFFAFRADSAG